VIAEEIDWHDGLHTDGSHRAVPGLGLETDSLCSPDPKLQHDTNTAAADAYTSDSAQGSSARLSLWRLQILQASQLKYVHRVIPSPMLNPFTALCLGMPRSNLIPRTTTGLYAGAKIRFGNTVSRPRMIKAPTRWRPNRHRKRLWSPSLNMFIRTRLTTRVLRTIDKLGGIDNYLLGEKAQRIKDLGPAGWALRWKVMQSEAVQRKFAAQRERLGLPPKGSAADGEEKPEGIEEVEAMLARDEEIVLGEAEPEDVVLQHDEGAKGDVLRATVVVEEAKPELEDVVVDEKVAEAGGVHKTVVVDAPVEAAREAAQEELDEAKKR
jgi:ribosomal protein L28